MPEVVSCPACQRKLQVPEAYFGQSVQCPECKQIFTAAAPGSVPPAVSVPPPLPAASETPPLPADGPEELEAPPRRRRFEDDEDDRDYRDRPRRRYVAPHRGSLILTFGILAIIPCLMPIFGPLAWIMGSHDLAEIRAGKMEAEGEGLTQGGRILGIIFTSLVVFCFGGACVLSVISAATGGHF